MEAGWTVSAVLAHVAFWDRRALTLIRKWKQTGIQPSPVDTDIINETSRMLCLAVPPGAIRKLVEEASTELDREIERLEPAMLEEISLHNTIIHLDRAEHRHLHRADIERVLGFRTTQPLILPEDRGTAPTIPARK